MHTTCTQSSRNNISSSKFNHLDTMHMAKIYTFLVEKSMTLIPYALSLYDQVLMQEVRPPSPEYLHYFTGANKCFI